MKWYFEVLKKYAVFKGRASRKEFWMFFLIHALIQSALLIIDIIALDFAFTFIFYFLVTLLPCLSVHVRRLHDVGLCGWWMLLVITPFGYTGILGMTVPEGQRGNNKYGKNPLGESA